MGLVYGWCFTGFFGESQEPRDDIAHFAGFQDGFQGRHRRGECSGFFDICMGNFPNTFPFLEVNRFVGVTEDHTHFFLTVSEFDGGESKTGGDLSAGGDEGLEEAFGIVAEGDAHEVGAGFASFAMAGFVSMAAHALGGTVGLEDFEAFLGISSGEGGSPEGGDIFLWNGFAVALEGRFNGGFLTNLCGID